MSRESLGVINWWGFSPSIDFLSNDLLTLSPEADVNILLVGCGDSRHILSTLSRIYRSQIRSLNIYVIESSLELYARYMLQIIVALISLEKIGLQEKTELFLELYGNTLVRAQTMDFVRLMATALIRLVTDPQQCALTLPFLDLDLLKFKEKDVLEAVFKIWRDPSPRSFDASLCWDLRLRQHLGVRYDAIPNVFDWDCSMILHDRGANIISTREYNHWRHKGVAFQLREANYDVSNRTLASGRVLTTGSGDKTVRLGFWGDIICSPYLGLGLISDNQDLFKKANNQYMWGASRVAEYNVASMFYEMAHGVEYREMTGSVPGTCAPIPETDESVDEDPTPGQYLEDLILVPQLKVIFLPVNALSESVSNKERFHNLFDLMYFSTSLVGALESFTTLPSRLKEGGKVVVETPKFIVNVSKEQHINFVRKVTEMCEKVGLEEDETFSSKLQETAHNVYKRK